MRLEWISFLVVGQLYAIVGLAVSTLFLLRWRKWKTARIEKLKIKFSVKIADVIAGDPILLIRPPARWQLIRRQALKEALLDHIASITGPERTILVDSYIELGLSDIDLQNCRSPFWSTRLEAVLCLSQLNRNEFSGWFKALRYDDHPLVSSCAILSWSSLEDFTDEPEAMLDTLPIAFFSNSSLLLEFMNVLVKRFGMERFESYVVARTDTPVGQAILAVMTTVGTSEATSFLLKILLTARLGDPVLVGRISRTIRESGDPDAIRKLTVASGVAA